MGVHLLYNDQGASGDEVKAGIVHEGVIVHLALQNASCAVRNSAQRGCTHPSDIPVNFSKKIDGNIAFEPMLLKGAKGFWYSSRMMDLWNAAKVGTQRENMFET